MEMRDMILVSLDDHLVEPPSTFADVPVGLKDLAPKIITKDGAESWVYEGRLLPNIALNAVVGRPPEEFGFEPTAYSQLREGTFNPDKRVEDMDADGVCASVCFPSAVGPAGQLFADATDKKAALALLQYYNDWLIDSWCGSNPGRFIPLGIVPVWDIDLAVAEAKRIAKKGARTISLHDNFSAKGLPSIHSGYWDPLFAVMEEERMVISAHIGTGNQAPHASPETPIDAWITTMPMSIAVAAADWLYSPIFKKFPNLKIALAEGGVGWVPYLLERVEFTYKHHRAWTHADFGGKTPSELFFSNFITCFISDDFGMKNIDFLNPDMICWECDYPHSDSVWPRSANALWDSVKHLDKETIDKITHLNTIREFRYDPREILGRENCTVGALKDRSKHVDTAPVAGRGGFNPKEGAEKRPVTSADVMKLFTVAL
ncbi:amidohydrolase [Tardibacter chloracetimidivorans]|uniref:Amidohydrolase n=1 Tax=Tardibacter chloracetimidivorans TaxID=1921510 RepID=A0A1L3ZW90_9SPHN|nr:amidohydrolase family protein [Tardibacter chloracetimidivorans]API59897.1 amidohydrolase [Tardibacter chloracetimidivorans]